MRPQQSALSASEMWANAEPSLPFVPQCDRAAVDQLHKAFTNGRPLTILIGEGKLGISRVISRFVDDIDGDLDVVRITEPCLDATECMREIVQGVGFESKPLGLKDLESIFRMFLSFQKTHRRRTILCIEETEVIDRWVLDKMRSLVELEMERRLGLMVILAGSRNLNGLLHEPPLESVFDEGGQRIAIAPFKLAETREYVRQCVESDGIDDVGQVFEFEAIDLIHDLSAGIPDTVNSLCRECFQLADAADTVPITPELVEIAAELLHLMPAQKSDINGKNGKANGSGRPKARLIVRMDGKIVQERAIDKDRILIGRNRQCDICIASTVVSRQHALVESSQSGIHFVDLDSTNGSFIDGQQIERYKLEDNEVIIVGECRIEYVAANYGQKWLKNTELADTIDPHAVKLLPSSKADRDKQLIEPETATE